jgi:hypothetical protein
MSTSLQWCPRHGKVTREYLVCDHVRNGSAIAYFQDANDGETGYMLCSVCEVRTRKRDDKPAEYKDESIESICEVLHLACGGCAARIMDQHV